MGKPASPFAGMKLTDQTPAKASGLDQLLFTSHPAAARPPQSVTAELQVPTVERDKTTNLVAAPAPARDAIEPHANVRTMIRTNERSNERTNIRHSFDCWADQLLALRQIAMEREIIIGDRVTLGDLVKEALDQFIANERSNERPDHRPNERTIERS